MKLRDRIIAATATGALALSSYLINPSNSYAVSSGKEKSKPVASQQAKKKSAQQSKKILHNRIVSDNKTEWPSVVTGGAYGLRNYCYVPSSSIMDFGKQFSLRPAEGGGLVYYVRSGKNGIRSELESAKREPGMTSRKRASIKFLEGLLGEMPESDPASVALLRENIKGGVLNFKGVKAGFYSAGAESEDIEKKGKKYVRDSLSICIYVPESLGVKPGETRKAEPEVPYVPEQRGEAGVQQDLEEITRMEKDCRDSGYIWKGNGVCEQPLPTAPTTVPSTIKEKKELSTRFIFDGYGGAKGLVGADFGIGYGQVHGPYVAFLGSYSKASNRTVDEKTADLSVGRKGIGKKEELDFKALGFAVEVHPIKYVFGGVGVNLWNYTTRVDEKIVSPGGDVLETNTFSSADKTTSVKYFGGLEAPSKDGRFAFRAVVGKDNKMGVYGGVGLSIQLNKNKR